VTQSKIQAGEKMSFANLINLSKVASLGYSCISSNSFQQITASCQTVASQETYSPCHAENSLILAEQILSL
jgi:hypothetical protein